jgi:hypothetical protein
MINAIILDQCGKQIRIQFTKDRAGNDTIMQVLIFQDDVWVHIMEHNIMEEV